ncbi:MAG: aldo/keto reductase [Candidatus Helarchaeota archaeon]|nr:aldo/keto reductase [Candidatus Helarchaeota archaeon]
MDYTVLGRTGLKVSVMGLGCGGPSRIGKGTGRTKEESIALIRQALDSGINIIDTSEMYGTEKIIGRAIEGMDRESLILSTKKQTMDRITPEKVQKSLEKSLKKLGTDYVDIYHLHAVRLKDYNYLVKKIVPTLQELQKQGKIRYIGITERFISDTGHKMLQRALQDDFWDVMMVGFNMLNQSARDRVFPKTIEKKIGVLIMFAVRLALSRPDYLKQVIGKLIEKNMLNASDINEKKLLDFLIHEDGAENLIDAAYRFCRYEPGTHVILSGTGNPEHLKSNIKSFSKPPLPQKDLLRLKKIFKNVDSVSGH